MGATWRILSNASITIASIAMLLTGCLPARRSDPIVTNEQAPSPGQTATFPLSATPVPATQKPTRTAPTLTRTATALPLNNAALPYDLLFLSGERLMRWLHTQNISQATAIDVIGYSASKDGSKIAILRRTGMTANAVEMYDLTILDTGNGGFVTLLDAAPRLTAFKISPDGQWVALMNELQQLYLLPSDGSDDGVKIRDCQISRTGDCDDLSWSTDSQMVIWDDAQGIWQASPTSTLPAQVIPNQLDIADPNGQLIHKQVQYHDLDWSPYGRYVLTRIRPVGSTVSWNAIIDTRLQRQVEIPESYQLDDETTAQALWLQNGNLLLIHPETDPNNQTIALESWQILPTHDDLMKLDFRWEITNENLAGFSNNIQWEELPAISSQISERILSLTWNSAEIDGPSGLFSFDLKYGILSKIAELPTHTLKIIWSPDGNAALTMGSDGSVRFVPVDEKNISDLTSRFGSQACCYTWLIDENGVP